MDGKLCGFCLITAILLSGSCCNCISFTSFWHIYLNYLNCSSSSEVIVVLNDTYSGVIQNGKPCTSPSNCTDSCASQHNNNNLCILSVGNNYTTSEKCHPSFNITLRNISSQGLITLNVNHMNDNQNVKMYFPSQIEKYCPSLCSTGCQNGTECRIRSLIDEPTCQGVNLNTYIVIPNNQSCWKCSNTVKTPEINLTLPSSQLVTSNGVIDSASASMAMKNMSSLLDQMGNASSAAITLGDVKGILNKLDKNKTKELSFGFSKDSGMSIVDDPNSLRTKFSRSVTMSKESSDMAVQKNGNFVAVLVFPTMSQDEKNSTVLNGEVIGIEMGVSIENLTSPINIHYGNIDKEGYNAYCNSWNGEGKLPNWTTDGCLTVESANSISCNCTHLTFFAILMSPTPKNISSSDVASLTYISYVGCGLSMFFLGVSLFMHFLMRKTKSGRATKILINLFVALFILNLTFLLNQSVANLGSRIPCVMVAAVMHYSMLSTFTWFLIEAVHLFLQLKQFGTGVRYYMTIVYVHGWVFPAVIVVALLGLGKYQFISINTNDGNNVNMCWISEVNILYGVNIGYYACVFICTTTVFVIVLRHIFMMTKCKAATGQQDPAYNPILTVLGLLFMLGITWGFAFFSFGSMTIPSYYIFSILNSFQGFFLFLYYYNSNKMFGDDRKTFTNGSTSTSTSNIYDNKPISFTYVDRGRNVEK